MSYHNSGIRPMLPTEQLYKLGRVRASGTVPDEARQSLPVPVHSDGRLLVSFFFGLGLARPGQPTQLFAPDYLATLEPHDGRLLRLESISPARLGISHPQGEVIGSIPMPERITVEDYLEARERLFEAYDRLLPIFERRETPADAETRETIQRFQELFRILGERPWGPYYRALGGDFFKWLNRLSPR